MQIRNTVSGILVKMSKSEIKHLFSDYKFVKDEFKITDEMKKDYNEDGFILVR